MKNLGHNIALLVATAWVGGQWAIGYLAVPVLFQTLPDKMQAGMLAGKMFHLIGYIGMASAIYLLAYHLGKAGQSALRQPVFWIVAVMLAITLIDQFGFQPVMADLKAQALPADVMHSPYAGKFRTLHGIASITYLVQSLLGITLILKMKLLGKTREQ
jgi:predicted cobalt transporter CbtA